MFKNIFYSTVLGSLVISGIVAYEAISPQVYLFYQNIAQLGVMVLYFM